jgi:hypothetical protein
MTATLTLIHGDSERMRTGEMHALRQVAESMRIAAKTIPLGSAVRPQLLDGAKTLERCARAKERG